MDMSGSFPRPQLLLLLLLLLVQCRLALICYRFRYSFLDDAFRKNLESALRFGNPLLVQVSWRNVLLPANFLPLHLGNKFTFWLLRTVQSNKKKS